MSAISSPSISSSSGAPPRAPSVRLALIVPGVAVLIMILGGIAALVGSATANVPAPQVGANVPGVPFGAVAGRPDLAHVMSAGEPPADVVNAVAVPANARYQGDTCEDAGIDQFDCSVTLSVPATPGLVRRFFLEELDAAHWSIQFNGTASGHPELIGQRDGSDGYQWRVADVISEVMPTLSPALNGASVAPTSSVVITVYQVEDAS